MSQLLTRRSSIFTLLGTSGFVLLPAGGGLGRVSSFFTSNQGRSPKLTPFVDPFPTFDGIAIETHEARPANGIELQTLLIEYSEFDHNGLGGLLGSLLQSLLLRRAGSTRSAGARPPFFARPAERGFDRSSATPESAMIDFPSRSNRKEQDGPARFLYRVHFFLRLGPDPRLE